MADEALVFGWLVASGYGREFMPRSKSLVPSAVVNKSVEVPRGGAMSNRIRICGLSWVSVRLLQSSKTIAPSALPSL
jgi:hypothetical protein